MVKRLALLLVLSACAGGSGAPDATSAAAQAAAVTIQGGDNTLVAGMGGEADYGSVDLAKQALTAGDLDDGYWALDLSAVFPDGIDYFGTKYDAATKVFVGTNGYVTFGQGSTSFSPAGIQYSTFPLVAGFYCDVVFNVDKAHRSVYGHGHLYVNIDSTPADPVVTLTYFAPAYDHEDQINKFQIRLHRVHSDPVNGDKIGIELRYAQMDWSSTTGSSTSAAGWADGKAVGNVPTAVYGTVKGSGTADIVKNATPDSSYSNTTPAVAGVYFWQPLAISLTGGDPQSATAGAQFGDVLQVNVQDLEGSPVEGATVTFSAPASGATATLDATTATTDAAGNASVHATAGRTSGSYVVTAFASGSGFSPGVTFHLTNTKATPSIGLASSANPSAVGQSVQLTATVSGSAGTPTGQVTFKDGSATLGTATLNGAGVATFTTASLAIGAHSLTAAYAGNVTYLAATSDAISQIVAIAPTSTALTSSLPLGSHGDAVTFTATVTSAAGTPTGTVTFMDGSATLGTAALDAGVATYTTSSIAVGTHELTAVYGGDASFATSTSSVVSEVINAAASATALVATASATKSGQPVTFTATVTSAAGTPTGTVTFLDGSATLGTVALDGAGVATYTTSALGSGTHAVTAAYGGDASFAGSTSAAAAVVVSKKSSGGCSSGGDAGLLGLLGLIPLILARRRARTRA